MIKLFLKFTLVKIVSLSDYSGAMTPGVIETPIAITLCLISVV